MYNAAGITRTGFESEAVMKKSGAFHQGCTAIVCGGRAIYGDLFHEE